MCVLSCVTACSLYLQWLPEKWQYQILFLLYRWIIATFFVVEIFVTAFEMNIGAKYFIFLTNLGFTLLTLYTLWSAVSVTYRFLQVHFICRNEATDPNVHPSMLEEPTQRNGCWRVSNTLAWYQMFQWLLFTLGVEIALGITLLFWSLLYHPDSGYNYASHTNLVIHLVNGITAIIETWVSSVPIRLLHIIYPATFGAGYIVFTGIYYAANGTGINGTHYIYPVIDYGNHPGYAAGADLIVLFVLVPVLHSLFFLMFMIRSGIASWLRKTWAQKHTIQQYDALGAEEEEEEKDTTAAEEEEKDTVPLLYPRLNSAQVKNV